MGSLIGGLMGRVMGRLVGGEWGGEWGPQGLRGMFGGSHPAVERGRGSLQLEGVFAAERPQVLGETEAGPGSPGAGGCGVGGRLAPTPDTAPGCWAADFTVLATNFAVLATNLAMSATKLPTSATSFGLFAPRGLLVPPAGSHLLQSSLCCEGAVRLRAASLAWWPHRLFSVTQPPFPLCTVPPSLGRSPGCCCALGCLLPFLLPHTSSGVWLLERPRLVSPRLSPILGTALDSGSPPAG